MVVMVVVEEKIVFVNRKRCSSRRDFGDRNKEQFQRSLLANPVVFSFQMGVMRLFLVVGAQEQWQ